MREKKFGKLFLTWLLAATMVLTLLPVSMLAMDAPDEAAEDGEAVLAPVAGVEEEEAAPVEAVPMLLAAPAVLLLRYRRQRRAGKRPAFRPLAAYRGAGERQKLYHALHPFEPEDAG